MFKLILENAKGKRLQLSNNPDYSIISVSGLNPPKATINTAINATFDGSTFKSSRLDNRNIVIMLAIEGAVELNRTNLYKYVKAKQLITVYFATATRSVEIKGYVETFDTDLFEEKETAQISIICPSPYFENAEEVSDYFEVVHPLFEFPFSIPQEGVEFGRITANTEINVQNLGDVTSGMIIEIRAIGPVSDPAVYNAITGERILLDQDMIDGDIIQINTTRGQKSVTLNSGGIITNILNKISDNSSWIQLEPGDNILIISATTYPENLQCTIYHSYLYEGV